MRYVILVLLNLPIILLAFMNIVTQYKLKKIPKTRFQKQILLWLVILAALLLSFPLYNFVSSRPLLDSSELSLFDTVEITAIVFLFYSLNNQRRKIEQSEKSLRNLHQELSIRLSVDEKKR